MCVVREHAHTRVWPCAYHYVHVEIREQLVEVRPLFPQFGFQHRTRQSGGVGNALTHGAISPVWNHFFKAHNFTLSSAPFLFM